MWVNENVKGFPWDLVLKLLETKYYMYSYVVDLPRLGWWQRRVRRLTFGVLKSKLTVALMPNRFLDTLQRAHDFRISDIMTAPDNELQSELSWARKRKLSTHGKNFDEVLQEHEKLKNDPTLCEQLQSLSAKSDFTQSLTVMEILNLLNYLERFGEGKVFALGQDLGSKRM